MKNIILPLGLTTLIIFSISCQQQSVDKQQQAIDSLTKMVELLKPGLGEFMIQMEYHHDKLAGAIDDKNYEKAGFEVGEMQEVTEKVEQLHFSNDKLQQPFSLLFE